MQTTATRYTILHSTTRYYTLLHGPDTTTHYSALPNTVTYFIWSGYYLGDLLSWQKKTWIFEKTLGCSGKVLGISEEMLGISKKTWTFEKMLE